MGYSAVLYQGRIQRGGHGAMAPPNHEWKIKTQLPRMHVGTAATINDYKQLINIAV